MWPREVGGLCGAITHSLANLLSNRRPRKPRKETKTPGPSTLSAFNTNPFDNGRHHPCRQRETRTMKVKILILASLCVLMFSSPLPVFSWWCGNFCSAHGERDTFGDSFRMARDSQILNPGAHHNLDPVEGMSGKTSQKALENYLDSCGNRGTGTQGAKGFVPLLSGGM